MNARDLKLVVTAALIGLGGLVAVPSAHAQIDTQTMQLFRQKAAALLTTYSEEVAIIGAAAADTVPSAKKVWAAALKVPSRDSTATAGFKLAPLTVGGTMAGAKVTARFEVSQAVGNKTYLELRILKNGIPVADKTHESVASPGTFTLTTDPITLQPGAQYVARATVTSWAPGSVGEICAAVATIPEIKWEI